jgi:Helix-turn-helix domain
MAASAQPTSRKGRKAPASRNGQTPPNAVESVHLRPSVNVATLHASSRIPTSTLRQWIREGKLPAYKVGRHVRVYIEDWENMFTRIGG